MIAMLNRHASLNHRVARSFRRLFARLTRQATLDLACTVAVPPFIKIAIAYKSDLGEPANDNRPRRRSHRSA
jgi:hypothetical protein